MPLYLEDIALGRLMACGSFLLAREEIIAFARRYDPQPWHLDEAAAKETYFGALCASGVQSQACAIGLMVRTIGDVAVVAGGTLNEARFHVPVWPDTRYDVAARWVSARPSSRNAARGVATISGEARDPQGRVVMEFGVTYIVARRT
jgi:acyl dehydratase